VLENGAYFDVLIEEIAAAKRSVHFESFLWKEGVLGQRVADALSARARAGVTVRVLLDAIGSKEMGKSTERQLEDSGCKLVKFHKWHIRNLGVMNERDHRKIVVLDGRSRIARWPLHRRCLAGNAEEKVADVSVRLRGPVVHSVQAAFSENWVGHTGELFMGDACVPAPGTRGRDRRPRRVREAGGLCARGEDPAPLGNLLREEAIWIQNPYFIPEPEAIDALGKAVARGVDVRVLMPSTSGSDNPMVQHAGHRNFEKLLRYGVRLFEYPSSLLHQKVMTIDGVWCTVGSANFDDRSFEINDEITLGFKDAATAKRLDAIFEQYLPHCQELELDAWQKRSWGHKLIDNMYYLFNELL
jgi:cardiolipin synthase